MLNKYLLIYFAGLVQISLYADIPDQLRDGAKQLQNTAKKDGDLDKIIPQMQKTFDQIAATQTSFDAAIKQVETALTDLPNTRQKITSNNQITQNLRTSLLTSVDNLEKALTNTLRTLKELKNDVVTTAQEKNSSIKKLNDKIDEAKNRISRKDPVFKKSLPSRMRSVANAVDDAQKAGKVVKKAGKKIEKGAKDVGKKIENIF